MSIVFSINFINLPADYAIGIQAKFTFRLFRVWAPLFAGFDNPSTDRNAGIRYREFKPRECSRRYYVDAFVNLRYFIFVVHVFRIICTRDTCGVAGGRRARVDNRKSMLGAQYRWVAQSVAKRCSAFLVICHWLFMPVECWLRHLN